MQKNSEKSLSSQFQDIVYGIFGPLSTQHNFSFPHKEIEDFAERLEYLEFHKKDN